MAIPNIVPRANNDGETLGTQNKKWSNVHTVDVNLNGVSLTTKLADIDSKNTTQDSKISTLEGSVSTLSSNKADKTNVYTKAEMNNSLATKADVSALNSLSAEKIDKIGGEVSGVIVHSNAVALTRNVNNSYLVLRGGDGEVSGAHLTLYGLNYPSSLGLGGAFQIGARVDASNRVLLTGKANGDLLWNNEKVLTKSQFAYKDFAFTDISYTAGTIGTRGAQKYATVTLAGYKPMSATIISITSSSNGIFETNMNSNSVYVNVYRTSASAQSNLSATVRVFYMAEDWGDINVVL